jgi:hypothetical protein
MLCNNIELSITISSKRKLLPLHKALIQSLFLKSIAFFHLKQQTMTSFPKTIKDLLGPGASTCVIAADMAEDDLPLSLGNSNTIKNLLQLDL